jgi:tetratricopeptide (TPR) repeat protein
MIIAIYFIIVGIAFGALALIKPTLFWDHPKANFARRYLGEKRAVGFYLLLSASAIVLGVYLIIKINAKKELEEITIAYKKGDFEDAQERLIPFTSWHPRYYMAWTMLGNIYLDQDDSKNAIECFNNGIKANKNAFEPYSGLGRTYAKKREFEKAKEEYLKANTLNPNDWSILGNLAEVYSNLGDAKKAVEFGEKSVVLNPESAILSANLSIYYHKDKQFDKRDHMLEMAEDLDYENMQLLRDTFALSNDTLRRVNK